MASILVRVAEMPHQENRDFSVRPLAMSDPSHIPMLFSPFSDPFSLVGWPGFEPEVRYASPIMVRPVSFRRSPQSGLQDWSFLSAVYGPRVREHPCDGNLPKEREASNGSLS